MASWQAAVTCWGVEQELGRVMEERRRLVVAALDGWRGPYQARFVAGNAELEAFVSALRWSLRQASQRIMAEEVTGQGRPVLSPGAG